LVLFLSDQYIALPRSPCGSKDVLALPGPEPQADDQWQSALLVHGLSSSMKTSPAIYKYSRACGSPRGKSGKKRAFSLVELLTAIVIITILAAILIPVINTTRKSAQTVKCTTHLRILYFAADAYHLDGGNYLSLNRNGLTTPGSLGTQVWFATLVNLGYLNTTVEILNGKPVLVSEALYCPGKERPSSLDAGTSSMLRSNYGMNAAWGAYSSIDPLNLDVGARPVGAMALKNPDAILFIDTPDSESWLYPNGQMNTWSDSGGLIPVDLHPNGANAIRADGMVMQLTREAYPDITNERYWNPNY
jgi:prepilin-type N-terminal cleavage/methylation domain-containing protein